MSWDDPETIHRTPLSLRTRLILGIVAGALLGLFVWYLIAMPGMSMNKSTAIQSRGWSIATAEVTRAPRAIAYPAFETSPPSTSR